MAVQGDALGQNNPFGRPEFVGRAHVAGDMSLAGTQGMSRRRFMLLSTTAIAAVAASCCRAGTPTTGAVPSIAVQRENSLSPAFASSADNDLALCIDVHCHIFNGQDVDIAGFLRGPVASDLDDSLRDFLRLLADVAAGIVYDLAPSGREELRLLAEPLPPVRAGTESAAEDGGLLVGVEQRDEDVTNRLAERLAASPRNSELKREYRRFERRQSGELESGAADEANTFSAAELRQILQEARQREAAGVPEADGAFRLVKKLCGRRSDNAVLMAQEYAVEAPRVTVFMPSLVDFNRWLGCSGTRTPLADQVAVSETIAAQSGGAILPIVPYNPWTDIAEDDASLRLVQDAIGNRGFVGVKIYPPMGYLPYGNANIRRLSNWPGWWRSPNFGPRLDAKLLGLYEWCRAEEVPILAHSSRSQGPTADMEFLAGPPGWRDALAACPGLKVCLGHFGGDNALSESDNFAWGRSFLELMREPQGRNLHGDLSYFSGILRNEPRVETFLREVLTSDLASRFMYGSDWHLLVLEPDAPSYAARLGELIASLGSAEAASRLRRQVFYATAVSFYGLAAGQPTRRRLEAFYRRHGVAEPAWMTAIAGASAEAQPAQGGEG